MARVHHATQPLLIGGRPSGRPATIPVRDGEVSADLRRPERAPLGLVMFAHGSGSSRFSSRNRAVAEFLDRRGFATLLLDLLTRDEEHLDARTGQYRFDIDL